MGKLAFGVSILAARLVARACFSGGVDDLDKASWNQAEGPAMSRSRCIGVASLLLTATLVCGCGFELAGAGTLPSSMQRTFVESATPNSEFAGSLRIALRARGSELVDSPEQADAVLVVIGDTVGQRVLSVSARNIPREYEIYYSVTVALEAGGERVMEPETLVVTRSYTYDETRVLGKGAEERVLRQALADDLARQVMRRVVSAATAPALPAS
jgi:LPS-assembly lipoprotein